MISFLLLIILYFVIGFCGNVIYARMKNSDTVDIMDFSFGTLLWPFIGFIFGIGYLAKRFVKFVEWSTRKKAS